MPDNSARLWAQQRLNTISVDRAMEAIQNTGWTLPCHVVAVNGAMVTVAFDILGTDLWQVEIPKLESPWIRMPTQVGDKGVARPISVFLGGVSGLGSGTAEFAQPGNFSALVFEPISNAGSAPIDQNAAQVQGPNGAIIRTTTGTKSQIVTDQNSTVVTYGSNTLKIDSTGITGTVGSNTLTITGGAITLTAPTIELAGNVTIAGTLNSGTSGGGTATFNGNISAPDLIVGGKSTVNHNHADPQGGTTGVMQN